MKRGTPNHPKLDMLRSMLGIRKYQAAGLLELLWHFTASYSPRGDVGKHTNEHIAAALDWPRKSANELVEALVECGWLEKHDAFRLVIHDWHDHADDTCDKYLQRAGLTYWNGKPTRRGNVRTSPDKSGQGGTSPDNSGNGGTSPPSRARGSESEPVPESESVPESARTDAFRKIKAEALELSTLTAEQWAAVLQKLGGHPRIGSVDWPAFATHVVREAAVFGNVELPGPWLVKRLEQWLEAKFGEFRTDGQPVKPRVEFIDPRKASQV